MSMSCLDCHDFMDGYNRGKREGTIEELKKIKGELENIEEPNHDFEGFYYCQNEALEIIDKRLLELKGGK